MPPVTTLLRTAVAANVAAARRMNLPRLELVKPAGDAGRIPDPDTNVPRLTHKALAEIVGTTRSRVSFFMNKFRTLGLIDYTRGGEITVMAELLTDLVVA